MMVCCSEDWGPDNWKRDEQRVKVGLRNLMSKIVPITRGLRLLIDFI